MKRLCQGIALAAFLTAPVVAFGQGAVHEQPAASPRQGRVSARYLQTEPPAQPPPVAPERARGDAPSPTPAAGETPPAAEPEAPPRPLMALLDRIGVGDALTDARINIFGHIEGSWTHNFSSGERLLAGRVFDIENDDPTLNQLDLTIERTVDFSSGQWDVGGRVEMIWGGDARFLHSLGLFDYQGFDNGTDNQFDLNQAYVDLSVPLGKGLRVRAGKFVTLLGQEVINPTGNALYSHSYLFGYAIPFTHTGVLGTYQASDKLTVNAGITRGWDTTLEDNNGTLDFLGGISYTISDATTLIVNVVTGPDQPGDNDNWRSVFDAIVTHKITDDLTIAVNGDYGYEANSVATVSGSDAQWFGVAGYVSKKFNDSLTLNGRAEYFNDQDGARIGGTATSWYEATVGVSVKPLAHDDIGQNLVIRPEVRFDYAEDPVFDGDYNQFTFGIDAYFTF